MTIKLKEGSTTLRTWSTGVFNTSNAFSYPYSHRISAPSSGSHTYKLTVSFTASGQLYADAPSLYVNDILAEAI